MPGQPAIAAGRPDGAAAFAMLVESVPADIEKQDVTTPVEEDVDEAEDPPEQSSFFLSEGVALPARQIPDTVPDEGPLASVENVLDLPSAGPRQEHRSEKAALPEAGNAVFAVIDEIVVADGIAPDSPDPTPPLIASSTNREDLKGMEQLQTIRPASLPLREGGAALHLDRSGSAAAAEAEAQPAQDNGRQNEEAASPIALDGAEQASFPVSVYDSRASTDLDHARTLARPQVVDPQHVVRQLREKLADRREGVIEIALAPEELGRIRLVIAAGEKPAVTVFADRPEIGDLLRRNADALEKELHDAGIFGADISFAGGQDDRRPRDQSPAGTARFREEDAVFADRAKPATARPMANRRIDIRI